MLIACEPLEDSSAAITVHVREDGERVVTDGPFAETKEQLGGFCLLDCENLDDALKWANKVPLRSGLDRDQAGNGPLAVRLREQDPDAGEGGRLNPGLRGP